MLKYIISHIICDNDSNRGYTTDYMFSVDLFYFDEVTEIMGRIGTRPLYTPSTDGFSSRGCVKRDTVYLFSFCQLARIVFYFMCFSAKSYFSKFSFILLLRGIYFKEYFHLNSKIPKYQRVDIVAAQN